MWIPPKIPSSCWSRLSSVAIYCSFHAIPLTFHVPSCYRPFGHVHLFESVPYFAQLSHNLPIDLNSNTISSKYPFVSVLTRLYPMVKTILVLWITPSGICQGCALILVCVVISVLSLSVLSILPSPQQYAV